jgi:hypothetical protein
MSVPEPSCGPGFFPHASWSTVPAAAVQQEFRQAWQQWGRPEAIRVDNGTPWGSTGEWPTPLALWVLGCQNAVLWNAPHSPQENGVVERSQGVSKQWSEPQTCRHPAELQRRLTEQDRLQREEYPVLAGQSRLAAYPGLRHSGRPYHSAWEAEHWDHPRVLQYLADTTVARQVSADGKVSLYDRGVYVGRAWAASLVYVSVDPERQEWVISTPDGQPLRRQPADELSAERIRSLTVARPRGTPKPTRKKGSTNGSA